MKSRLFALALCLTLLSGCGGEAAEPLAGDPGESPVQALETPPEPEAPSLAEDEEASVLACRIVDGAEDGTLLLAKLCRCPGADVYRLSVDGIPVTLDGEPADASALEDGMPVEVSWNGMALETFPAQMGEVYCINAYSLGTEKNPGGTCYDLCGLYLQVLDDLWEKDSGLNEQIALAGLDLSRAPGNLAESEKAAIAWRFGEKHSVEVVTGTFEELKDQGYFTAKVLQHTGDGSAQQKETVVPPKFYEWEDGCLFTIEANEDYGEEIYTLPVLFFNAEKWRTPLGAYCFYDCSAAWPEMGPWSGYSIGAEMIS